MNSVYSVARNIHRNGICVLARVRLEYSKSISILSKASNDPKIGNETDFGSIGRLGQKRKVSKTHSNTSVCVNGFSVCFSWNFFFGRVQHSSTFVAEKFRFRIGQLACECVNAFSSLFFYRLYLFVF